MTAEDADYRQIVRTAQNWRARIASGELTEPERQQFEAWLAADMRHEEIYDQAETYWAAFDHFRAEDVDKRFLRRSWPEQVTFALDRTKSLVATTQFKLLAATAAIALVATPILLTQLPTEVTAPIEIQPIMASHSAGIGETVTVTLSDGTIVTLGADTQIETEYYPGKRIVHLASGAALFEVASDSTRPFTVASGRLEATALGTVFEVRSNGGVVRVGVAEGRVRVAYPYILNDEPTRHIAQKELGAGEQIAATRTRGLRNIETVNPERVGAWRDELLLYNGATLAEIVADANRYSEREFMLDNVPDAISASEINASFRASDIDGMLAMLPQLYPVTIDDSDAAAVRIRPRPDRD